MAEWSRECSGLYCHAERELRKVGLLDSGSDYDGMIGEAALEVIEVFARQGHSGGSAGMLLDILPRLLSFEPLSPLTDSPEDWMQVQEGFAGEPEALWQCKRKPSAFSNDGGKTYYDLHEGVDIEGNPHIHTSKKEDASA